MYGRSCKTRLIYVVSILELRCVCVCVSQNESFQMCAEWSFDWEEHFARPTPCVLCFQPHFAPAPHSVQLSPFSQFHVSPEPILISWCEAQMPALQLSSHYSCHRAHAILNPDDTCRKRGRVAWRQHSVACVGVILLQHNVYCTCACWRGWSGCA